MLAWNGSMGVSRYDGIVSPAYCVYRFKSQALPGYFHELLRSPGYKARIKTASTGVVESRLRLYSDDLGRIEALLPPAEEQAAIVRFLDHVGGRIERAIRAKRKVIALLQEQKRAIIHRAVTGDAELQARPSSGHRWFPRLPDRWGVLTLGRVISAAIDGPHFSPRYRDAGIPFLSARNIRPDRWLLKTAKYISEGDYVEFSRRVRPVLGDVLYTKGGTTGVAKVVDLPFPFQVWVHVAVLKLRKHLVVPEFLAACLNSDRCYEQAQLFTRGATNQDLGLGRMKAIELPVPHTLEEQRRVVDRISSETRCLEQRISTTEREVELLREYRTRLTADVVTGKLDVREATGKLPAETHGDQADAVHDSIDDSIDEEAVVE
ncbi:MAG: restriction endonuclease subunit S [Planctomycetota bacterium]